MNLIAVDRAVIANPDWAKLITAHQEQQLKLFDREILKELY